MQENLKKEIGTAGLAMAVVNITVGSGIFVLPALAAENLGAAAILSYFICGTLIFLIACCFAEVGSTISVSGGTYAYIESAFGPFAGFLSNHIFWFGSCVLSDAAAANALIKTLSYFFPALDTATARFIFFLFLFGILAFINVRGAKKGVRFIVFITIAKLIPLLLIIGFGSGHITVANLHWTVSPTLSGIGASSLVLFYAFLGIEGAVSNSGEFKNPAKVVPLGILTGLSFVLLLYIIIQLVCQGVMGDALMQHKEAPLAALSGLIFGKAGVTLVIAGTAISILGSISGEMLAIPRILFAGARNRILPGILAKVHPVYFTPHRAIIIYAMLGFLFAVLGAFKQLIVLASAATLLIYLGVVLAVIKLRYTNNASNQHVFRIPGGITVPVLATIIIGWLLSNLSPGEIKATALFIVLLSAMYMLMKRFRRE